MIFLPLSTIKLSFIFYSCFLLSVVLLIYIGGDLMRFGDVGARIKEKRKEKKLTQAQLADLIDKTESSIRKYEKNLVEIPSEVMKKIAEALGTSESYLDGIDMARSDVKKYDAFHTLLEELGFDVFIDCTANEFGEYNFNEHMISYNNKTISIDNKKLDALEKDIYKYIEFRMLDLFDKE